MIDQERFSKAREFIYRQGDLLTRKRFAYHFEDASKQDVLSVIGCYQNSDGGFGNGLELDILCPNSSGICMEMALGYILELEAPGCSLIDGAVSWVTSTKKEDGEVPHPSEALKGYPHGGWWEGEDGRIMSIAAYLELLEGSNADIRRRAASVFQRTHTPFPDELGVYSYPAALYLRCADVENTHQNYLTQLDAAFPKMIEKEAWHHPLFFCHNRWGFETIPDALWSSEAERSVATIQEDGGVLIDQYAQFPWWRPVWTLDLLVILKQRNMLGEMG